MINIEQELFALLPKGVTEIMPNHCHNRVTIYVHHSDDEDKALEQIAKIKSIFEDEAIFTHFIPEPDWTATPNENGELPVKQESPWVSYRFPSTNTIDDRWYDWRLQNWDTKWDAYDVEIIDDDPDQFEVCFDTAWSPPEAICHAMREQYPDLSVSWFYDEPGMEIAGYL